MLLLATDKRKTYFRVFILAMFLNIITNIAMGKMYGANGTIVAIYTTEIFIVLYAWIVTRRNLRLSAKGINTGYESK
jgi:O-antigen/teichoic acid export membrane protein